MKMKSIIFIVMFWTTVIFYAQKNTTVLYNIALGHSNRAELIVKDTVKKMVSSKFLKNQEKIQFSLVFDSISNIYKIVDKMEEQNNNDYKIKVRAAIEAEGWPDVVALEFPARCGRPPLSWAELRPLLPENCSGLLVLGRACLNDLGVPPAGFPPVRLVPQAQCFHMVAEPRLVDEAIGAGAYLLTPSWLAEWPQRLRALGFEPHQAGGFFADFAKSLVLLDSGLDPQAAGRLAEFQAMVGLPARAVAVGLDHTRLLLCRLVLTWRLEQAQQGARREEHVKQLPDGADGVRFGLGLGQPGQQVHRRDIIGQLGAMLAGLLAGALLGLLQAPGQDQPTQQQKAKGDQDS